MRVVHRLLAMTLVIVACSCSRIDPIEQHRLAVAAGSAAPPPSWSVPNWFVDDSNVTTTASDANGCTTAAAPCRTKAEIFRRWGTHSPILNGVAVTITYLSPDVDLSDPGIFTPFFTNGGQLHHTAALPAPSFTGTLLAVTPKNVAANQALQSTFTTTTGAMAAHMLLIDTTRSNSRAISQRLVSGALWQISQPQNSYGGSGVPSNSEDNGWSPGDSIQGYVPMAVNLAVIGGQTRDYTLVGTPSHQVSQITFFTTTNGGVFADAAAYFFVQDCIAPPDSQGHQLYFVISGNTTPGVSNYISNSYFGQVSVTPMSPVAALAVIYGGIMSNLRSGGALVSGDVIVDLHGDVFNAIEGFGPVFVDSGITLRGYGSIGTHLSPVVIYGPGTYDQIEGVVTYAGAAVASIPIATKWINGVATAYSHATSGGVTTLHGGISLTSANLDAAAGATGFGGFAFAGASAYSNAGAQP